MRALTSLVYENCRRSMLGATLLACAILAHDNSVGAALIPITNAGFESTIYSPPPVYGALTAANNPGGWISSSGAGYNADPPTFTYGGTLIGAYFDPGSTLTNVLSSTWAAGTYTLKGFAEPDRGGRANSVVASLLSGATLIGSQSTALNGSGRVFVPMTDLTVTVATGSPIIGTPITILAANGAASLDQVYVDEFSLNYDAAVPEPSALGMLGLGLVGVAAKRFRKNTNRQRD